MPIKFYVAKNNNLFCFYCRTYLNYGEHYVALFFYREYQEVKRRRKLFFHLECYPKWCKENFSNKYRGWKMSLDPPKKRGSPKKHSDPRLVNRLKSLLYYHRRAGNENRALELQTEITELERTPTT